MMRKNEGTSAPREDALAVLDWAIATTGADFGNIQLLAPSDGSLRIVAQRGFSHSFLEFFRVVNDDRTACGAAMSLGRQVVVPDVRYSPIFTEPARRILLNDGVLACQSTPILAAGGRVIGMLSTHYNAPYVPAGRRLLKVDALARRAASLTLPEVRSDLLMDVRTLIDDIRGRSSGKTETSPDTTQD